MSFFDGSSKSISFGKVGDNTMRGIWQGGQIVNISEPKQQTDMVTKEPKFFPKSNDPIMKVVVTLDTRAPGPMPCPATPVDENDDGTRDYHVAKGTGQFRALGAALREGHHADIAVGGWLYDRWVSGVGEKGDPRQHEALYYPPVQGSGGFMNDAAPAQQTPPVQQQTQFPPQVAPQQQQAPAAPRFDPNTGQPITPPPPPVQQQAQPRFDPNTGQPIAPPQQQVPAPGPQFDPNTGQPIVQQQAPPAGGVVNPYAQQ